jgi:catechol 2,3-dioxygenase-like lactoylglutathione lyase family enzyme
MWNGVVAQLPVTDLAVTQAWYRDVLGFEVAWASAEFGAVWKDRVEIFFARVAHPSPSVCLCVRVDDADALLESYRQGGARIVSDIEDKPWGMREFTLEDPNGHRLRVGHPIPGQTRWVLRTLSSTS